MKKIALNKKNIPLFIFAILVIVMGCAFLTSTYFTTDAGAYEDTVALASSSKAESGDGTSSITAPVTSAKAEPTPSKTATDPMTLGSLTQLVNKNHGLPADYEPGDLVAVQAPGTRETYMRSEAADAMVAMITQAAAEGLDLKCCSAYRSYEIQASIYNNDVGSSGEEAANTLTAVPGFSEHQTGLTMDLTSGSVGNILTEDFVNTAEGQWLADNAYKYGFIVRYPADKTDITGYDFEPWHVRYLGNEVAKDVYESGKCYEEYLGILN